MFALLAAFLAFSSVSLAAMYLFSGPRSVDEAIVQRIKRLSQRPGEAPSRPVELEPSLYARVVRPLIERLGDLLLRITPWQALERTRQRLIAAGSPGGWQAHEYLAGRYLLGVLVAAGALALLMPLGLGRALYGALFGGLLAVEVPELLLARQIAARKVALARALPDVLDLLTVSVEAGLGFDAALAKVVEKEKGPLGQEFAYTLQQMRLGQSRREALRDLGMRTGVEALRNFTSALLQADQLGVSIGRVLRVQSDELRRVRRQQAEEKAMKAPIKMMIPMIFFIFPTLFIVLLGPAVIQMIAVFRQMGS